MKWIENIKVNLKFEIKVHEVEISQNLSKTEMELKMKWNIDTEFK